MVNPSKAVKHQYDMNAQNINTKAEAFKIMTTTANAIISIVKIKQITAKRVNDLQFQIKLQTTAINEAKLKING